MSFTHSFIINVIKLETNPIITNINTTNKSYNTARHMKMPSSKNVHATVSSIGLSGLRSANHHSWRLQLEVKANGMKYIQGGVDQQTCPG